MGEPRTVNGVAVARVAAPVSLEEAVAEGAPSAVAASPPPMAPSRLERWGARLLRTSNRVFEQMLETLEAREPWERYRPRSTALPPTFPTRDDRPAVDAPSALAPMAYSTRYDIHYDGDFLVNGRPGMAVRFDDVMARPDWPTLLRDQLSHGDVRPGDPLRVFIPGLNTPNPITVASIPVVAQATTVGFVTMANGSTVGLDPIVMTLPGGRRVTLPTRGREWLQGGFQRIGISVGPRSELRDDMPRDAEGRVEVPPGSGQWLAPTELRDLRSALNELSDPNKVLIDNVQRLVMAHIDRDDAPPLELWGYSEGSLVLGKAFEDLEARYLAERMRDCPPQERTQRLASLRARFASRLDRVTVLGIGSAYGQLGTPVRRVDFYAADAADQVSRFTGSPRMTPSYRFVNDLVRPPRVRDAFIPYQQPFSGFDAHNFYAAGGSALGLYFEQNGARSVRALHERERTGDLVHPTLEQVIARIRRNGGEQRIWDANNRLPPLGDDNARHAR